MVCSVPLALNFNDMIRYKLCGALQKVHLRVLEIFCIDIIQSLDVGITLCFELLKVKLKVFSALYTVIFHQVRLLQEISQVIHDFLGNAANVNTCAANHSVFDHKYSFAVHRCSSTRSHAARARTNHDIVVVCRLLRVHQ